MQQIRKYPRTHHLQGSRLQPGDEDLEAEPVSVLHGCHVVVEEKLDGANCAISFDEDGNLLLQSRGHYLTGGPRERHFELLKSWASGLASQLQPVLTDRFVVYGEWMYAKHTIFYDRLPHYFMEFDVLDCRQERFLSTKARRKLLRGLPFCPVPVVHAGEVKTADQLHELIGPSRYKSGSWRDALAEESAKPPHKAQMVDHQTDQSDLMEGLYIKLEDEETVTGRYKFVRASFLTTVMDSQSHWQSRPILKNRLAPGASKGIIS